MKKIVPLIIIVLFLGLIINGWWSGQLSPVSSDKSTKIIVVENGESFSKIVEDLKNQKLIKSTSAFNLYAKQSNLSTKVQAGTFRLSPSMTSQEILKTLTSMPLDVWVTLLEGWRVEEMAEKINFSLGIPNAEFLKVAKEGYMFPDTYLIPKDYSAEQIAKKMRDNFDTKYSDDLKSKIRKQGLNDNQGVILASIVEREARTAEPRRMVASILLRRFKIDMGLYVDSTLQYALGYQPAEKSWWKKEITNNDKKVNSAYNTYVHAGFPPTPICNPSLSSLEAVAGADPNTPYLYYFHDSQGVSHYSRTLEEHNQQQVKYP